MFTEHLPGGSAWGRPRDESDMVLALMMGLIPELPELLQIENCWTAQNSFAWKHWKMMSMKPPLGHAVAAGLFPGTWFNSYGKIPWTFINSWGLTKSTLQGLVS